MQVSVEVRLPDGSELFFTHEEEVVSCPHSTYDHPLQYPRSYNRIRPIDLLSAVKRRLNQQRREARGGGSDVVEDGGGTTAENNTDPAAVTVSVKQAEDEEGANGGRLSRANSTVQKLVLTTPLHLLRLYNNNADSAYYGRVLDNHTNLGHAQNLAFLNGVCNSRLEVRSPEGDPLRSPRGSFSDPRNGSKATTSADENARAGEQLQKTASFAGSRDNEQETTSPPVRTAPAPKKTPSSVQELCEPGGKFFIASRESGTGLESKRPVAMKLAIIGTGLRNETELAQDFVRYVLQNRSLLFVDIFHLMHHQRKEDSAPGAKGTLALQRAGSQSPTSKSAEKLLQGAEMAFFSIASDQLASSTERSSRKTATSSAVLSLAEHAFYDSEFDRPSVIRLSTSGGAVSPGEPLVGTTACPGMRPVSTLPQPLVADSSPEVIRESIAAYWDAVERGDHYDSGSSPREQERSSAGAAGRPTWKLLNDAATLATTSASAKGSKSNKRSSSNTSSTSAPPRTGASPGVDARLANLLLTGDYVVHCLEDFERDGSLFEVENEDRLHHSNLGDLWKVNVLQAFRDEEALLLSTLEILDPASTQLQAVHPEHDGSLLHDAVCRGFFVVVSWLKKRRPEEFYTMLTQVDQYGYTPLQYACEEGNLCMCELLWSTACAEEKAAQVGDAGDRIGDEQGRTGATSNGDGLQQDFINGQIATALNLRVPTMSATRESAINQGAAYPYCVHGRTPLHGACFFGCRAVVDALLTHPLFLDSARAAPLAGYSKYSKMTTFVSPYMADAMGRTPFHWACLGGHVRIVQRLLNFVVSGTSPGGTATSASFVAAAPSQQAVFRKMIAARDKDGFGGIDFACGSAGSADRERWFVLGGNQQELRVVMPGCVVSQGTDGVGVTRMRWAGRECTTLLPVGDSGSEGVVAYLKYLFATFLAQSGGLRASFGVVTLDVKSGGSSLCAFSKQAARAREAGTGTTTANSSTSTSGPTLNYGPSAASLPSLGGSDGNGNAVAEKEGSGAPATTVPLVLESYMWQNGELITVDEGAFCFSPDSRYLPPRFIDGKKLADVSKAAFLTPDRVKALDLDLRGYSGRVLLLHHSGNASLVKMLMKQGLKHAFGGKPAERAAELLVPSLRLRHNFVDRCFYNNVMTTPAAADSSMGYGNQGPPAASLVSEFYKEYLPCVPTLPEVPGQVTPLDILLGTGGAAPHSARLLSGPRGPGGTNANAVAVAGAPPVLVLEHQQATTSTGAARQTTSASLSEQRVKTLGAVVAHPHWRGKLGAGQLLVRAVERVDYEAVAAILPSLQRWLLDDVVTPVWNSPEMKDFSTIEERLKTCAAAFEMAVRGVPEAQLDRASVLPLPEAGVLLGTGLPPGYFSGLLAALLNFTTADVPKSGGAEEGFLNISIHPTSKAGKKPRGTWRAADVFELLKQFFVHDLFDAFCVWMSRCLRELNESAGLETLSMARRMQVEANLVLLLRKVQTRFVLDTPMQMSAPMLGAVTAPRPSPILSGPREPYSPVLELILATVGKTALPRAEYRDRQHILKCLIAIPFIVHPDPFTANALSLWRMADEPKFAQIRQEQMKVFRSYGFALVPAKERLLAEICDEVTDGFGSAARGGSTSKEMADQALGGEGAAAKTGGGVPAAALGRAGTVVLQDSAKLQQSETAPEPAAAQPIVDSCFSGILRKICFCGPSQPSGSPATEDSSGDRVEAASSTSATDAALALQTASARFPPSAASPASESQQEVEQLVALTQQEVIDGGATEGEMQAISARIALQATTLYEITLEAQRLRFLYQVDQEFGRTILHRIVLALVDNAEENLAAETALELLAEMEQRAAEERSRRAAVEAEGEGVGAEIVEGQGGAADDVLAAAAENSGSGAASKPAASPSPSASSAPFVVKSGRHQAGGANGTTTSTLIDLRMKELGGSRTVMRLPDHTSSDAQVYLLDLYATGRNSGMAKKASQVMSPAMQLLQRLVNAVSEPELLLLQDKAGNSVFHLVGLASHTDSNVAVLLLKIFCGVPLVRASLGESITAVKNKTGKTALELAQGKTAREMRRVLAAVGSQQEEELALVGP